MEQKEKEKLRQILLELKGKNTQEWLSHELGVSKYAVASWISMLQSPSASSLEIIADYMGISLSELLAEIKGNDRPSPESAQQALLHIKNLSSREKLKLSRLILEQLDQCFED